MLLLDSIYLLVLILAAPWLLWRRLFQGRFRRGLGQKFFGFAPRPSGNGPVIWLHAVSVGELNLLPPLMRELEALRPGHQFMISTTTETGFDHAVARFGTDRVFFFPFDFSWAVIRALRRIRPELVVLCELELWPGFLMNCGRAGVPVALVNARMSDRSFSRYRRAGWLARKLLGRLSVVCAQNELYGRRFRGLGVPEDRVAVTGNLKFDGANTDRNAPQVATLARNMNIDRSSARLFVAGSTQPEEHPVVLDACQEARKVFPDLRLVIVPRHPSVADDLCGELARRSIAFVRRSTGQTPSNRPDEVIVVDVIGELPGWWGLATAGFVGGSMGRRGGQSMIEPAALGVPVCFGPNVWNFRDVARMLEACGAATTVRDGRELLKFIWAVLENRGNAAHRAASGRSLVLAQQGAAVRTARHLISCRPNPATTPDFRQKAA